MTSYQDPSELACLRLFPALYLPQPQPLPMPRCQPAPRAWVQGDVPKSRSPFRMKSGETEEEEEEEEEEVVVVVVMRDGHLSCAGAPWRLRQHELATMRVP